MTEFKAGQTVEVRVFNDDTQKSEWVSAIVNFIIKKGNVVAYDVEVTATEETLIVYQGGEANEIR